MELESSDYLKSHDNPKSNSIWVTRCYPIIHEPALFLQRLPDRPLSSARCESRYRVNENEKGEGKKKVLGFSFLFLREDLYGGLEACGSLDRVLVGGCWNMGRRGDRGRDRRNRGLRFGPEAGIGAAQNQDRRPRSAPIQSLVLFLSVYVFVIRLSCCQGL